MSDEYYDDVWGRPTVPEVKITFKWDSISDDGDQCVPIVPQPPRRIRTVKPKITEAHIADSTYLMRTTRERYEAYRNRVVECPICNIEKGFPPFGNQVKIEEVTKDGK